MATETAAKTYGEIINGMASGVFKTLCKIAPMGSLQARKQVSGAVALFWRYSLGTTSERVPVGLYSSKPPPKSLSATPDGFSIAAAIRAAEVLAREHHAKRKEGGRPAVEAAKREVVRAQAEAKRVAAASSLAHLLGAYCDYLQSLGRRSHTDARSIFNLHVTQAWPKVAAMPAREVTAEQVADMMRLLIEAGKGRTSNKLRSYVRAAFEVARAARFKPSIPIAFKAFNIGANPAAETLPDESQNRPAKNPLNAADMRAYWNLIEALPGFRGALLRLHLLTGAQRIAQLANLRTINATEDSILLFDGKGRPGQPPRPHLVPLTAQARKALFECNWAGTYALSTDGGKTHVSCSTFSEWATVAAAEHIDGFQAKRIRSGVETLLASAGVSQDIRGRLQSHGVSGVQARHYDGYSYHAEKLQALEVLHDMLIQRTATNIAPIKRKRA
jgi:integrase